jgi:cytochrome c oxidase cbb3-type subunit III
VRSRLPLAMQEMRRSRFGLWLLFVLLVAQGCDFPGRPDPAQQPVRPDQIFDFDVLFRQNCSGCHGANGVLGPAPPLADPLFVQIVPDAELSQVISHGRPGTLMPPFAKERGGPLTARQVDVVARGIKQRFAGKTPVRDAPSYLATTDDKSPSSVGDVQKGAQLFARACASCHGESGGGGDDAGAVHQTDFLALMSNQALRRIIITGRPDLGMPDFAGTDGRAEDFHPLTSQEIADLVALLASWRSSAEKM